MEGRDKRRDGKSGPRAEEAHADALSGAFTGADAERLLAEQLEDGPIDEPDREERVRAILPPKYEVRIRMEYDPIVEETKRYCGMAREIDGRYDRFMIRMDEEENGQDGER